MWVRVTPGGCLTGAGARGLAGQAAWGAGGWPGWLARRSRAAVARRPVVMALNRLCTAQGKGHSVGALGLPRTDSWRKRIGPPSVLYPLASPTSSFLARLLHLLHH